MKTGFEWGGGGNFGIVTSFEFRLHPLGPIVMLCAPMYPAEQAKEVLHAWREFMDSAPDEFTTEFFFWRIPTHPNSVVNHRVPDNSFERLGK